jgi:hypothetical protein
MWIENGIFPKEIKEEVNPSYEEVPSAYVEIGEDCIAFYSGDGR